MPRSHLAKLLTGTALVALMAPGQAALAADPVGVVTLANPDAFTQPPQEAERPAAAGDPVVMQQRFRTDDRGQAHLLFEDKSNITIGPKSEMRVDEFVYDPAGGLGAAVLSTTTGVFRFVGGQISKEQEVEIRTPVATLGVRGGVLVWQLRADGSLVLLFLFGDAASFSGPDGEARALQPGTAIILTPGADGLEVLPAPPELIDQLLGLLEGQGGPYDPGNSGLGGANAGGGGVFDENVDVWDYLEQLLNDNGFLEDGILTLEEWEELIGLPGFDEEELRDFFEQHGGSGYSPAF